MLNTAIYERTQILVGDEGIRRLQRTNVFLAGALVRSGIGAITLADHDVVSATNKNRQLVALDSNIGKSKVEVLARRLQDINPHCNIIALDAFLFPEEVRSLLERQKYDYVVDCIDSVDCKVALLAAAVELKIEVYASCGAGGRMDPSLVQMGDLFETENDGLARACRSQLRKRGIGPGDITVVFSRENGKPPLEPQRSEVGGRERALNGTISYMPPLFGLMLSAAVIRAVVEPERHAAERAKQLKRLRSAAGRSGGSAAAAKACKKPRHEAVSSEPQEGKSTNPAQMEKQTHLTTLLCYTSGIAFPGIVKCSKNLVALSCAFYSCGPESDSPTPPLIIISIHSSGMDQWSTLRQSAFSVGEFAAPSGVANQGHAKSIPSCDPSSCTEIYRLLASCFAGERTLSLELPDGTHGERDPEEVAAIPSEAAATQQILRHHFEQDSIRITPRWREVDLDLLADDEGPTPRFGHTAVLYKRKMFVFGGRTEGGQYLNDVLCYDLDTKVWTSYGPPSHLTGTTREPSWPHPRCGHAAAVVEDRMYVLGGELRQGVCLRDMWSFHFPSTTWRLESTAVPIPRKGHTMHYLRSVDTAKRADDSMLVVFGGADEDGKLYNDVCLYGLTEHKWKRMRIQGDIPCPRSFHVSQLIEHTAQLIVFGGRAATPQPPCTYGPSTQSPPTPFLNDLFILDITTGVWEKKTPRGCAPTPRYCCSSVFANGVFAVFCGGDSSACCAGGYEFHVSTEEWRAIPIENQPMCSRPTVVYAGDQLIFFGGCTNSGCLLNKILSLSLPPLSLRDSCAVWVRQSNFQQQQLAETMNACRTRLPTDASPFLLVGEDAGKVFSHPLGDGSSLSSEEILVLGLRLEFRLVREGFVWVFWQSLAGEPFSGQVRFFLDLFFSFLDFYVHGGIEIFTERIETMNVTSATRGGHAHSSIVMNAPTPAGISSPHATIIIYISCFSGSLSTLFDLLVHLESIILYLSSTSYGLFFLYIYSYIFIFFHLFLLCFVSHRVLSCAIAAVLISVMRRLTLSFWNYLYLSTFTPVSERMRYEAMDKHNECAETKRQEEFCFLYFTLPVRISNCFFSLVLFFFLSFSPFFLRDAFVPFTSFVDVLWNHKQDEINKNKKKEGKQKKKEKEKEKEKDDRDQENDDFIIPPIFVIIIALIIIVVIIITSVFRLFIKLNIIIIKKMNDPFWFKKEKHLSSLGCYILLLDVGRKIMNSKNRVRDRLGLHLSLTLSLRDTVVRCAYPSLFLYLRFAHFVVFSSVSRNLPAVVKFLSAVKNSAIEKIVSEEGSSVSSEKESESRSSHLPISPAAESIIRIGFSSTSFALYFLYIYSYIFLLLFVVFVTYAFHHCVQLLVQLTPSFRFCLAPARDLVYSTPRKEFIYEAIE
eukprot:gene7378-5193_t